MIGPIRWKEQVIGLIDDLISGYVSVERERKWISVFALTDVPLVVIEV